MRIVILDGYTENPGDLCWDELGKLGELTVYDRTASEEIIPRIKGYDAVIVNKTPLDRETIYSSDTLKYIGILATGYNIVDIEAARQRNIPVCNAPGYSTMAVAQMVFSLILEMTNHVGAHTKSVHDGEWIASKDFAYWKYPIHELDGKTMGIIGYGSIGRSVGKIARAFGMKLLVNSRHPDLSLEDADTRYASYDEIFEKSDVISLHCPLFEETKNLINEEAINKMKKNVLIVNTARGPVVNEHDIRKALDEGRIAGFGCDVISKEPMAADNPLLGAPNCYITPHIAWAAYEARVRLMEITASNLKAFIDGSPVNVVN